MGVRRRIGFVSSSDEEDEGGGAGLIGVKGARPSSSSAAQKQGAGPSSSSAAQKRRKRSISQAAFEPHSTAGKTKEYKRLKHTVESKVTDLVSDSDEEDLEYEDIDIIEAASRQRRFGRKEDGGVMKKNGKGSSKLSPCKKRKPRFLSAQKTYGSKAGGIQFEETAEESTQQQTADAVQPPLGKEFEQYLLEDVFNISKDTYTKEIDLPERFQKHEQFVSAYLSKGDWSKEAHWIYDRAFGNSAIISQDEELRVIADIDKEEIVQEIMFVLMQLHLQKCEIPFIGMYNFHGCMHLARRNGGSDTRFNFEENDAQLKSFKALWCIFHWDRKWLLLQHHIDKQQETWKKRALVKENEFVAEDGTLDMLIQALQDAESELVVDDMEAKFKLQFPTDEVAPSKGQYKRPKRQSYYDMCCKLGLRRLVKQLGLTPEQLGENLQAMQKIHEALDCDVPPEGADLSHASGQFAEVHHALAGARHMAAYEISCEPRVRNYVRSLFSEHAVLSTRPTTKGKSSIDTFHEFACVKHVEEKSVKKFDDGEWLIIQRAEEEELVEVTIELTQEIFGVVMQGLQKLYFSNGSNELAVLWNEQRKLTLQEAISKMILPLLIKEMRMSLTAKAKAWVQSECGKNLWKRASVAPYPTADASPDDYLSSKVTNDATGARVLACCWGSRNPPTTFVMLDAFGELIDTLQTGYLNLYSGSLDQQLQRKTHDQERLQKFIVKHQPHVVVVGATVHHACRHLKDTIAETVARAAEMNTSLSSVPVIYGDESLPSLYEKSQVSNTQLPKQPNIIRRAVALGRSLQNPLALMASLCNPSKDIVALNLHPMQRFLSAEELYSTIEQVMITVTNQVWVDVNLAVMHEWLFSPLQFICGLGWKKACMLQQLIQGIRWLPSRGDLLRCPFSLKDVVFRNCSGFLRIRRVAHALSGLRRLDPLDDTRIHPDSYELARNLAIYALSKEQPLLDSEADMDMAETAIVHIRENPDTLTEETVLDFFNSLQEMEQVKIETLKDIRAELLCGFRDYRSPYTQPTQAEEFNWLTGEDDTSLASGKPVNVTVHKVFRHRIMCVLDSGIRGVLEKENYTSDSYVDLTKIFSEGSRLTCCIANVMKDQFLVSLTCKEGSMRNEDHNADASSVQEMLSSDKAIEKLASKDYIFKPRDVCHSRFDNVSVSDAIKALSDKNPGEVVFHPSSRGPSCLSMTLKCHDTVYLRKEIEELDKDSTNLATYSKLGGILKIGGRCFQNLDEVVTSYASPLMGKMNEVLQLKEFQFDCEIKSFLHQEKGVSSESLVYCFSMCPNNPAAIAVSYIVDGIIKRETVDLYPEGYGFQNKMFRKIDTLVCYLKASLAASYGGGQGEGSDGAGRERGRGGRFGSGRRGRGRGGRGNGFRGKWGDDNKEDHNKKTEEDAGAGNNSWGAGNVGNDGWGTGSDGWGSTGCHMEEHKKNEKDPSSWGAVRNSKSSLEEKANEWAEDGNAGKHVQDNKSNGLEGWGMVTAPLGTVSKDVEDAKDSHNGWDPVEKIDLKASTENQWGELVSAVAPKMEAFKNQIASDDGGSLGEGPTVGGWGESSAGGWGDDGSQEKHSSGDLGCGAQKVQNNGGWGDGGGSLGKGPTVGGWGKSSAGGWGDDGSQEKHRSVDLGSGAQKGQNNGGWGDGGGLLGKGPTVGGWGESSAGGWGDDDLQEKHKSAGGWGDDGSQEKHRSGDLGSGAQKGQNNGGWGDGGGLLGPTVGGWGESSAGGWGDDDLQEKHKSGDLGCGAQKGQNNDGWGDGGLLGKSSFVGGWGDDDSQEKHKSGSLGWGAQKGQNNGGWGGHNSSEENNQQQTQNVAQGYNARGSFRGGRGRSRGTGRGGRGRWSQGEGGTGRGGRGSWAQSEDGMGRGGRDRWSQNEGDAGRDGRGGWPQNQGDGAGRRGRGGRGRWNGADNMGRGGRGSWAQKQGEGANDNAWSGDGWNRDSMAGKVSNDWWASGGNQDVAQKESGLGNSWASKENVWDGWASSSGEVKTVGWGDALNNSGKISEETAQNCNQDAAQKEREKISKESIEERGSKDSSKDGAGTGWDGWASSSSEVETVGWGDSFNNNEKMSEETAQNRNRDAAQKEREKISKESTEERDSKDNSKDGAGTGWEVWASSSVEVETGDTLNNSGKMNEETAQNCNQDTAQKEREKISKESTEQRADGIWGECEDLIDSKEMEGLITQKGPFDNAL